MASGFTIEESPGKVLAMGDRPSVFEPKGEMAERRERLRQALARMDCSRPYLIAQCGAPEGTRGDLENWLLYNVGFSHFHRACSDGLLLSRSCAARVESYGVFEHWWSYENVDALPEIPGSSLVAATVLTAANWPTSAARWWELAAASDWRAGGDGNGWLALDVAIPHARSLPGLLKPMVDGILSALHVFPGDPGPELVSRIGEATDLPHAQIVQVLRSPRNAALGSKRFVWAFRQGLQWSPDDDRLRVIRIRRSAASADAAHITLSRLT